MFTIPNHADAAFPPQAEVDKVDLDIITAAFLRTFVVSGCLVQSQVVVNQTVRAAAGNVRINGVLITAAGSVSLAIDPADATLGRFDLIGVHSTGVSVVVPGTAAAVPVFPDIPPDVVITAAVYIPPATSSILSSYIIDKRMISTFNVDDIGVPPTPGLGKIKIVEMIGTVDGVNKQFVIPEDYQSGTAIPIIGGLIIRPTGYGFSGAGNKTCTFGASVPAPAVGEWVGVIIGI